MKTPPARLAPVLAVLCLTPACGLFDLNTTTAPLAFQGFFEAIDLEATIDGEAGMVSQFGQTQVEFQISGLDPNREHGWLIRRRGCEEHGTMVLGATAYPPFVSDGVGDADAGGSIPVPVEGEPNYAVVIYEAAFGVDATVACATMHPVDPADLAG
jgi:hypothetical protein